MRAARWDTSAERGGLWVCSLRRRSVDGVVQPLTSPSVMTIYRVDPSAKPGAVVLTVTGTAANNTVDFRITESQTTALAAGRYEHKITVTDPVLGGVLVLVRGYLTVYDTVQG